MTEIEQQIAIAKACGVTDEQIQRWIDYEEAERQFQCAEIKEEEYYRRHLRVDPPPTLPDYVHDLNAMHEAEKQLPINLSLAYLNKIYLMCPSYREGVYWYESFQTQWEVATSTAAQRAEAFLRTIGKWHESSTEPK